MKFGGTSLKDAQSIRIVGNILKRFASRKPVIIASAHHGVTEKLIALAHNTIKIKEIEKLHLKIVRDLGLSGHILKDVLDEFRNYINTSKGKPTLKRMDKILSFGERLSVRTLAAYLNKHSIHSKPFDSFDIGLLTDSHFGQAQPLPTSYGLIAKNLKPVINRNIVPVVTGFIGKDHDGDITTLGRNGSDYSATIIGSALNADEVQLWSDSEGIMTADPRIVPEAKPIDSISFDEASELAYYSRRFHPSTLVPAIHKNIPVRILNTYKPDASGTAIIKKPRAKTIPSPKSVVSKKDIFLITITSPRMLMQYGFLKKIFNIFAKHKIVIDMIATSEVSVSVTTDRKTYLAEAVKELSKFSKVKLQNKQAVICVIGEDLKRIPGVSGDIFSALRDNWIEVKMISQGATRTNIAFLVDNRNAKKAIGVLHNTLFR
jgi:aspartate kinase